MDTLKPISIIICCLFIASCFSMPTYGGIQTSQKESTYSTDRVTAYRVRTNYEAELDEDAGWDGDLNEAAVQTVDTPFRIRFEVESSDSVYRRQYSLQYRWNDEPWRYAEAHDFPYPSAASPPLSIVGSEAFFYGEDAENLIQFSEKPANTGAGISLAPTTPGWYPEPETGASAEWEFALVIRRWSDGPRLAVSGDRVSLRLVDQFGRPLTGPMPQITVDVPDGHLGGTFVETPARIGPYENSRGELYFIMEPTETDNVFMVVKSEDGGKSWFEVDGENRPKVSDLEGVGSVTTEDGIIHMVHQISEGVYHHSFAMSNDTEQRDAWLVNSRLITSHSEPPTQTADIAIRPDGSLVTVFAAGDQLQYAVLMPNGNWSAPVLLSHEYTAGFTNPSIIGLPDGSTDVVFKSLDGKGWHRQILPDNSLTPVRQFADQLGSSESENIAFLPLIHISEVGSTVAIYRKNDGYLYASFRSEADEWSEPLRVTDRRVVTNAVDSEQAGADVSVWEDRAIISFISEKERDIYYTVINGFEQTPKSTLLISGIDGSWLRGNILYHQGKNPVYGLIYDAGSKGGSGFNKYISVDLVDE